MVANGIQPIGHCYRGMAEHPLHGLDIGAGADGERCRRVRSTRLAYGGRRLVEPNSSRVAVAQDAARRQAERKVVAIFAGWCECKLIHNRALGKASGARGADARQMSWRIRTDSRTLLSCPMW